MEWPSDELNADAGYISSLTQFRQPWSVLDELKLYVYLD